MVPSALQIVAEESRVSRQHHGGLKHRICAASLTFYSHVISGCFDLLFKTNRHSKAGLIRQHRPWITPNCLSAALKADTTSHYPLVAMATNSARYQRTGLTTLMLAVKCRALQVNEENRARVSRS